MGNKLLYPRLHLALHCGEHLILTVIWQFEAGGTGGLRGGVQECAGGEAKIIKINGKPENMISICLLKEKNNMQPCLAYYWLYIDQVAEELTLK